MMTQLGLPQVFKNRTQAGVLLSAAIKKINLNLKNGLVLGLPRGGVVVAKELARSLKLPLDTIITRKIGAPENPEFALAAVDEDGVMTGDAGQLRQYKQFLDFGVKKEKGEIRRRLAVFRGTENHPNLKNKEIIIVDDGIATGQTMVSAIRFAKRRGAAKVFVAVPVLPADTTQEIKDEADGLFYLYAPESFWAVGQFYSDFPQISDEEVVNILSEAGPLREILFWQKFQKVKEQ